MMTIRIEINSRTIALAKARNVSDLAAVSDYEVDTLTDPGPSKVPVLKSFRVSGHCRDAGAWELARRIADMLVPTEDRAP
jgi:hypothetical protein